MRRRFAPHELDQVIAAAKNAKTDYAPHIAKFIAENVEWVARCHFKLGIRPTKDDPGVANILHRYLVLRKDGTWDAAESVQPDRVNIRGVITGRT